MAEKFTPRAAQSYRVQRFLAEPTKAGLIADDMGVGKTMVGVEIAVQGGFERVLFIGVKDTYDQWAERLEAQSDGRAKLRRLDSTKAGRAAFADFLAGEPGFYFAGAQFLTAQDWDYTPAVDDEGRPVFQTVKRTGEYKLRERTAGRIGPAAEPIRESVRIQRGTFRKMKKPVDLIVFDEVHMVANRKSIGGRTLRTIKSGAKLALSGTWVGNKFENAWAITRWLWPDLIDGSFHRWKEEWCAMGTVRVSGGAEKAVVVGEKEPGKFAASLPLYIRSEAEEKAPEPTVVLVDLTPRQRLQYDELERDLMTWLDSHAGQAPLVADLPITLRQRLRTVALGEMSYDENGKLTFADDAPSSKLVALRGILDHYEAQHPGQPVGIYVDSKVFAKVAVRRMRAAGYKAELWSGDVNSKERAKLKQRFLDGEIQYLVSTIASFSTGLDGFQRVCSKVVWLEESENRIANDQAIARYFRPGRTKQYGEFEQVKILARDTHDVGIFGSLIEQRLRRNAEMRMPMAAAA